MTHNTILHAIILGSFWAAIALGVFLEARNYRALCDDSSDQRSDGFEQSHNDNAGAA